MSAQHVGAGALAVASLLVVGAAACTHVQAAVPAGRGSAAGARQARGFRVQKRGSRWWLVSPDGRPTCIRAVAKVDTADWGGSGGFLSYDAVYVQPDGQAASANLASAAADSARADVVSPTTRVTLRDRGDALYLGSARFRPNYTYFWLGTTGQGGAVSWEFSTPAGWRPVNGTGRPFRAAKTSAGGGWRFDVGDYMAPDADGFGAWGSANANKLTWFDMAAGFPADFAPVALPGDPTPRFYIRAVVAAPFTVAPVLNQVYERAELEEAIARKYGPGDYRLRWAEAMTERLLGWGFNAAGMYSPQYAVQAPRLPRRLPYEPTWQLSGWALDAKHGFHAKGVYTGAVFPPGSGQKLYQGVQGDVFDPAFRKAYMALVPQQAPTQGPWAWALIPEEADYLFGIDKRTHDHMGYVVLSQNPHMARDADGKPYDDARFYAKLALRDFLRSRYAGREERLAGFTAASPVPAYRYVAAPAGAELAALQRLNVAWGTRYTTWETMAGDVAHGTNAYGTGTGFLDENGKSVLGPGARSIAFDRAFTDPAHPAIGRDLDDFVGLFAERYGRILADAVAQVPHPPLLLPVYDAPPFVYRALAPYVDGFWVHVPTAEDAQRIYEAGHKPLVVADYLTADPDSQLYFRGTIASVRYDAAKGSTVVDAPDVRYPYRVARFVTFPQAEELNRTGQCGGKYVYPFPRVKAVHGTMLEVPGDFTACVKPGMRVEAWKEGGYPLRTQAARADVMAKRYDAFLNLRGSDGVAFVMGFEHWCLYDPSVSNWGDNENFGLATLQDNAYDGVEARRRPGRDARGYPIGGEEADYGDLIGPLGRYLRGLDARLAGMKPRRP